jgi:hypothetical protein
MFSLIGGLLVCTCCSKSDDQISDLTDSDLTDVSAADSTNVSDSTDLTLTYDDAVIYPEIKGDKIDVFFYDLKYWIGAVNSETKANYLFIEDGMNGLRIPIFGNDSKSAHPSSGVVDASYYETLIASINQAKSVIGSSDFTIFASKKLEGDASFPDWVKDDDGIIPSEYARLLADYIEYFNDNGISIDVLGIDNERVYNEGNITPEKYKETIDSLISYSLQDNFTMPLTIAPEDYGPNKNSWMKTMSENGWLDRMDYYGTHYYPAYRPISGLMSDLDYAGDIPFWSTEPHWDNKSDQDELAVAEYSMCALWDQIDQGMTGFMWWGYELTTLRGYMMRNASVPLLNAQPIYMNDMDGVDISTLGMLQTRAFIEEDQITVYAINMSSTTYEDYGFKLNSGSINGSVTYKQWTDDSDKSGISGSASSVSDEKFQLTLPERSITSFTFTLN